MTLKVYVCHSGATNIFQGGCLPTMTATPLLNYESSKSNKLLFFFQ